jgi:hypothetical protein
MSITPDIEAARRVLNALSNPNHKNTMKPTLDSHDRALAQIITAQNAAALALQSRISNAERIKAAFTAGPSETAIAGAVAAVGELDALNTLQSALPPAEHRERSVRDDYVAQHRDELIGLLSAELENRLTPRPQWRRAVAAQIAKLSERLALREEGATALAAASIEADKLDASIAASAAAEGAVRRAIADLASNPTFQTLNDAKGSLSTLNF